MMAWAARGLSDHGFTPSGARMPGDECAAPAATADALEALDAWSLMVQNDLPADAGPREVFQLAVPILRRITGAPAVALVLTDDQEGLFFEVVDAEPPNQHSRLASELAYQVEEGTFGWSIYQDRCVIVAAGYSAEDVLLHVISDPDGVHGVVLVDLGRPGSDLPDHTRRVTSVLFHSMGQVLRSQRLNHALAEHGRSLEARMTERTLELARSRQEVRASSSSRSHLLDDVAHELRSPVGGIVGMASLLSETTLNHDQRRYLEIIQEQATELAATLDRAVHAARSPGGAGVLETAPFDLRELVSDLGERLAPGAVGRAVDLSIRYPVSVPDRVEGDANRLRKALQSALEEVLRTTSRGWVELSLAAQRGSFVFTIQDSSNTPVGDRERGLADTRHMVDTLGGVLVIRYVAGQGGETEIRVPLLATPGRKRHDDTLKDRHVILCVPQDARSVQALVQHLEERGATVTAAPAATAERRLRDIIAGKGPVPALILDGTSGALETTGQMLSRIPEQVPVGLLTSATDRQVAENAVEMASRGMVLVRPVRRTALERFLTEVPASPNAPQASGAPRARVLVAEDDLVSQSVARGLLHRLNCEAVIVGDGEQALQALEAGTFDLILMDWYMPVMNGLEAVRRIRSRGLAAGVPIVALTASAMEGDRERAVAAGMSDYLTKPLRPDDLKCALDHWLPAADARAEAPSADPHVPDRAYVAGASVPDPRVFDVVGGIEQLGSRSMLLELVEVFDSQVEELRDGMRSSLKARAFDSLGLLAHRLKGAASSVGARHVRDMAEHLESSAELGNAAECQRYLGSVDEALVEFERQSRRWLNDVGAA